MRLIFGRLSRNWNFPPPSSDRAARDREREREATTISGKCLLSLHFLVRVRPRVSSCRHFAKCRDRPLNNSPFLRERRKGNILSLSLLLPLFARRRSRNLALKMMMKRIQRRHKKASSLPPLYSLLHSQGHRRFLNLRIANHHQDRQRQVTTPFGHDGLLYAFKTSERILYLIFH